MNEVTDLFRRPAPNELRKGLLFYLEVMEEALVLLQNQLEAWPLDDYYVTQLQQQHASLADVVAQLRSGHVRPPTTPTRPRAMTG